MKKIAIIGLLFSSQLFCATQFSITNSTPVGVMINYATCLGTGRSATVTKPDGYIVPKLMIQVFSDPYSLQKGVYCSGSILASQLVPVDKNYSITRDGSTYYLNGQKMAGQN